MTRTTPDFRALRSCCGSLIHLAKTGDDLIALGEALDAIERVLQEEAIEVNVGLSVGFRRGDEDLEEGLFVCFRINWEEIILGELNTTYSRAVGSDRYSRAYAELRPGERFDEVGFEDWLTLLEEVLTDDDARLQTERDHI
jgi:hypothetical protein